MLKYQINLVLAASVPADGAATATSAQQAAATDQGGGSTMDDDRIQERVPGARLPRRGHETRDPGRVD